MHSQNTFPSLFRRRAASSYQHSHLFLCPLGHCHRDTRARPVARSLYKKAVFRTFTALGRGQKKGAKGQGMGVIGRLRFTWLVRLLAWHVGVRLMGSRGAREGLHGT